jgi:hypothetical protein
MFSKKTLLVVGAGASAEVKMPVGVILTDEISTLLSFEQSEFNGLVGGDGRFVSKLYRTFGDRRAVQSYLEAGRQISQGIKYLGSIDNFIDTRGDNPDIALIGKAAIAWTILKREADSDLMLHWDLGNQTWYPRLGRLLAPGSSLQTLDHIFDNLSIVCFNYDRCIEQFFWHWLQAIFPIAPAQATAIVDTLVILRPYGRVGPLTGVGAVEYGQDPDHIDLRRAINNLKTYTEQIEDQTLVDRIRSEVEAAELIMFLGFGFHEPNLRLLKVQKPTQLKRVFASAVGLSVPNRDHVVGSLQAIFRFNPQHSPHDVTARNDLTCAGLFDEYFRMLS